MLRKMNNVQRELVLEVIHRLHCKTRDPIQIFLTGPAGAGKTYLLKAPMETYNRYSQGRDTTVNAYLATGGLALSRQVKSLTEDVSHSYYVALRNVEAIIVDEISMFSLHIFNAVNFRLQQMKGNGETFAGMDLYACGDLKQLPPVFAFPVYSMKSQSIGGGAFLWQSLDYFPLTKIMRQNDWQFSSMLTKIGSGDELTASEVSMIESRFRNERWCEENLPEQSLRLFFSNSEVDTYNKNCFRKKKVFIIMK